MDIWSLCDGASHVGVITDDFVRIVESQQQIATSQIVDNLEEQSILESLLDDSKPPLPERAQHLHYLLSTPFRYPPLMHGSRFGQRHECSLLYASKSLATLLAEASYYRFVFWRGMCAAPPARQFITEHTVFGGRYYTEQGVQLQHAPFDHYTRELAHPAKYDVTQQLGNNMRAHGVEAIEYVSARDRERGINVALYTPEALSVNEPLYAELWLCSTSQSVVRFSSRGVKQVYSFAIDDFYVDGELPTPAC